jgi:hypothetical protein
VARSRRGATRRAPRGADQFEILRARSLGPLEKARAFGMTSLSGGLICSSEEAEEPAGARVEAGREHHHPNVPDDCVGRGLMSRAFFAD